MQIETERLILREFRDDDLPAILAYWSDPRYQRFNPDFADVEGAARDLVAKFVAAQTETPRWKWQLAITTKTDDRPIGSCGVRVNDPEQREGNIGYELDPRHWGRGYATEAARAILAVGFADLGLHRVWASCIADNVASARVMEKLGMRPEARFRERRRFKDRWWDTLVYAILDHEWRAEAATRTS